MERRAHAVLALPLTRETWGLIGAAALAAMKPTTVLINVGRGGVVDETALVAALAAGRLRGATLDVFEQEPLPAGDPLWSRPDVLLSPHCADHVPGWLEPAWDLFVEKLGRFRRGEALLNVVHKARGY